MKKIFDTTGDISRFENIPGQLANNLMISS